MKPIKLRLVSDGTLHGTKLIDIESGRELDGLCIADVDIDASKSEAVTVTCALYVAEVNIVSRVDRDESQFSHLPERVHIIGEAEKGHTVMSRHAIRVLNPDNHNIAREDVAALSFHCPDIRSGDTDLSRHNLRDPITYLRIYDPDREGFIASPRFDEDA